MNAVPRLMILKARYVKQFVYVAKSFPLSLSPATSAFAHTLFTVTAVHATSDRISLFLSVGILYADGSINNEASTLRLGQVALSYALAGAHVVAPSDMCDGRIQAIKRELIRAECVHRVAIMSYSAKFASAFYGPFRYVLGFSLVVDGC
jgi:hypothetical protein